MTHLQQSDLSSAQIFTLAVPAPRIARSTQTVEIVRAESELLAIDELMAELTDEFVAEARR